MAAVTFNVKLSEEQANVINREVDAGNYTSASEIVREALRLWLERRVAAEVAEFDRLANGLWERDTTPTEQATILRAQKAVRAAQRSKTRRNDPRGL